MQTPEPTTSWATKDEMKAIDFIGSAAERKKGEAITLIDRKKRLKGYIKSCHNRIFWGTVNKRKCEQYAQSLLAEL